MDIPSHIEFLEDSERILRGTLLAVTPQEGCALLIGKSIELQTEHKPNIFKIQLALRNLYSLLSKVGLLISQLG